MASINAQLDSQHQEYLQSKENINRLVGLARSEASDRGIARRSESSSTRRQDSSSWRSRCSATAPSSIPAIPCSTSSSPRKSALVPIVACGFHRRGGWVALVQHVVDGYRIAVRQCDRQCDRSRTSKLANPEQRLIKLALFEQNSFTMVRIENYYDSRLKKDAEGNLFTTKRNDQHRHGFGVKSIRHIAQQYGGEVTIRTNDHWFVLTVCFPARPA